MKSLLFIFVQIVMFISLSAQIEEDNSGPAGIRNASKIETDSSSFLSDLFSISGQAGLYGEVYSISGKKGRRKPTTGRLFFRPTLTFFKNFNIAFDILLSTEGSSARQQINRISLHPNWSWGKAHLGDFNHQFSQLTLNGLVITGGGLEIQYGIFRLEVVGGRTKRKINAGLSNSSFTRYLGGLKLGIGKVGSSFIDLNILRIKDDPASLPKDKFDPNTGNMGTSSSFRVTPKENLVVGINGKWDFKNLIQFHGEFSGSVISRDIYSNIVDSDEIPKFVNDIFAVRYSTGIDYAYNAGMDFKYDVLNARANYSVINPGYTSLGLSTNLNDRRTISFDAGIRLLQNKLTIRGNYRNNKNNLLSQKQSTLSRTNFGMSASYLPIPEVSLSIRTSFSSIKNDVLAPERKINNLITLYSINMMWRTNLLNLNHTLIGSFSNQQSKDFNVFRKGNGALTNNFIFGVSTIINKNWSIAPRVSINTINLKNITYRTTSTYGLNVSNKMLGAKLTNSAGVNYMNSHSVKSSGFSLQSGYKLTSYDIIKVSLRSSFYWGKISTFTNFHEYRGNLTYTHRF